MTTPTITLCYAPRTRSFTALWLLEELGVPYELESFDLQSGAHKQPEFLALNPMGKVPLVVCDGTPIAETGAIALYLADRCRETVLSPEIDDPARADVLRWCSGRLARFKQPRSVRFLDALPRNATGNVLKRDLRG